MLTYGLTGGIGSGKSFVADIFRDRGVPVFDADELGRELLDEGTEWTRKVIEHLPDCADGHRRIDRRKLSMRVFTDSGVRKWLEELLHPAIWDEYQRRISGLPPGFCLLEGAVLLESESRFPLAGLLVVHAPLAVRRERLLKRGLKPEEIEARLAAQLPEHVKLQAATHVIDNSGDRIRTAKQVDAVLAILRDEHGGKA